VRVYTPADGAAVVDLVVSAGMFSREEAGFLADGALESDGDGAACFVEDADDGRGLASVVYYRPEEAAERAFDLTMIAVRPDLQSRGQRLLIVRTSGTSQYDGTRAFYRRLGYVEHTRVPDYWTDGDDLVLFSRRL
jgi:ribosomal protein S18 acetylase RimI-like enzyme